MVLTIAVLTVVLSDFIELRSHHILGNKSTSYGAFDLNETGHVLEGFNFTQLHTNYPELNNELDAFERHLIAGPNEVKPLKAWQMQNLGLQATQTIIDVANENATDDAGLLMLQDLSQNFPSRA